LKLGYAALLVWRVERDAGADRSRWAALGWCAVELAGVLIVGTLSVTRPNSFPDATVWGQYGQGYGFVPLVLPPLAAFWLRRATDV
jgi:hypothetical protein